MGFIQSRNNSTMPEYLEKEQRTKFDVLRKFLWPLPRDIHPSFYILSQERWFLQFGKYFSQINRWSIQCKYSLNWGYAVAIYFLVCKILIASPGQIPRPTFVWCQKYQPNKSISFYLGISLSLYVLPISISYIYIFYFMWVEDSILVE